MSIIEPLAYAYWPLPQVDALAVMVNGVIKAVNKPIGVYLSADMVSVTVRALNPSNTLRYRAPESVDMYAGPMIDFAKWTTMGGFSGTAMRVSTLTLSGRY